MNHRLLVPFLTLLLTAFIGSARAQAVVPQNETRRTPAWTTVPVQALRVSYRTFESAAAKILNKERNRILEPEGLIQQYI